MNLYFEETNELVELPQELMNHRGQGRLVTGIAQEPSENSQGKVLADGMTFFPSVFKCYIADEPRGEGAPA